MHDAPGHILLAEDNPISRRVATAMLEHLGFDVDVVADGAEAVKAAIRTPYRAIFMDCQLPVLDGYETAREIRRQQGPTRHTPIIAVTASATATDRRRCLAAGMDDHLTKPLSLGTLAALLARWVPDTAAAIVAAAAVHTSSATEVGDTQHVDKPREVLDAQVVGHLVRLGTEAGEDLLGNVAVLFLADADTRIVDLREAVAEDDAAAVEGSAHTLSGASANLGATDLARMCADLATEGAAGDLIGAGALLDAIEAELEQVRAALPSARPAP